MKRSISLLLAILMATISVTAIKMIAPTIFTTSTVRATGDRNAPVGYNEHDYNQIVAWLEQTDENGVKNGEKYSSEYDPAVPNTWGDLVLWEEFNGEKRLSVVCDWRDTPFPPNKSPLVGTLDLNGCTELNGVSLGWNMLTSINVDNCPNFELLHAYHNKLSYVSFKNCPNMQVFHISENELTGVLDLSTCSQLQSIACDDNRIEALILGKHDNLFYISCDNNLIRDIDISGCSIIEQLYCSDNLLTKLDLSALENCMFFERLDCSNNLITTLDLTVAGSPFSAFCGGNPFKEFHWSPGSDYTPGFALDLYADGLGYFDVTYLEDDDLTTIEAFAVNGSEFLGWFNENGECVYDESRFIVEPGMQLNLTARFVGGTEITLGDVDGDGTISVADAIFVIRKALELIDLDAEQMIAADVDANGQIGVDDALLICRHALGLIEGF
ncbi:MAG: hypothetical protein J1E60_00770 [Christensenellaceae bacterium]|nr:hypothetical protein [Christensenellaceae bacterium]